MFLGWLIALKIKNTSYVDVLWAYGVGILGIVYLYLLREDCHPARHALLLGLLGVWSARLGTHLLRRYWGNRKMPATSTSGNIWAKKQILILSLFSRYRRFWVVLFASPFLILASNPSDLLWFDQVGMFIWIVGFIGVSLADKQLPLQKFSRPYPSGCLQYRAVEIFPPSQLFFRMGLVAGLSSHGDSFRRWRMALPHTTHPLPLSYQDYRDSICGGT